MSQVGEWERLQPYASGASESGQEDAIAAEEHVANTLNPGDLEVHAGLEGTDMTWMDAQRFTGLKVAHDDFAAEFQPRGSEA